jgi:hypothetical protein
LAHQELLDALVLLDLALGCGRQAGELGAIALVVLVGDRQVGDHCDLAPGVEELEVWSELAFHTLHRLVHQELESVLGPEHSGLERGDDPRQRIVVSLRHCVAGAGAVVEHVRQRLSAPASLGPTGRVRAHPLPFQHRSGVELVEARLDREPVVVVPHVGPPCEERAAGTAMCTHRASLVRHGLPLAQVSELHVELDLPEHGGVLELAPGARSLEVEPLPLTGAGIGDIVEPELVLAQVALHVHPERADVTVPSLLDGGEVGTEVGVEEALDRLLAALLPVLLIQTVALAHDLHDLRARHRLDGVVLGVEHLPPMSNLECVM